MPVPTISPEMKKLLERQQYRLAGSHSAVKVCHWTKRSLRNQGHCYKQKFYGIESHRCLQMTPWLDCPNRCLYCWRVDGQALPAGVAMDGPEEIIESCIRSHRKLLSGFKGRENADLKKWKEAQNPNMAAISLAGEPTLYPRISELVSGFRRRGFTAFLVTNGQYPERLGHMDEPSSLYISLDAPGRETYLKADRPSLPDFWERLLASLELMKSFSCRKVIRLTLVKGLNMHDPEGYAKLISIAEPDFIEVKGYMFLGFSRRRLSQDNMPLHSEVKAFSEKLSQLTGYQYRDEQEESRVVLLGK